MIRSALFVRLLVDVRIEDSIRSHAGEYLVGKDEVPPLPLERHICYFANSLIQSFLL